jgi:nociceptin receptor
MTAVAIPSALRYKTVTVTVLTAEGRNISQLDVKLTPLWQNHTFVVAYNWLQSLLRSIIPLFVLVFTSSFIINALRKTRANKRMASRNKITIMLIIVILSFLVCIIPDAIMSAFFNLGYTESENYLVKGVREITDMLLGVNAMINFELYMIFNKLFRDQFLQLFCKRCVPQPEKEGQYQPLSITGSKLSQRNGTTQATESKL